MNAIETLRGTLGQTVGIDGRPPQHALAALAKLDTLLQAAETTVEHDPDETEGRAHLYALAAAVRDAKGDTT